MVDSSAKQIGEKTKCVVRPHMAKYSKLQDIKKDWTELEDPGDVFSLCYHHEG